MDAAAVGEEYRKNGCVKIGQFLSPELLNRRRACFERTLETPHHKLPASQYPDGTHYTPATGFRSEAEQVYAEIIAPDEPLFVEACKALWGNSGGVWFYDHEIFHKKADATEGRNPTRSD